MGFLGPIFTFLANLVGWGKQREGYKNAPDVKAAAIASSTPEMTRPLSGGIGKMRNFPSVMLRCVIRCG